MKKSYAKSLKEYESSFELDSKKILAAMKHYKDSRKKPTSVALDETTQKGQLSVGTVLKAWILL